MSGLDLVRFDFRFFGDGEFYFRVLSDVSGRDVFVVLSMFPDPSFSVVRGLFYVSTLKDLGADRVSLIAPYLAYSRQDKRFLEGECVSSKVVVSSFLRGGADKIVTIDVHSEEAFSEFSGRFFNLSSVGVVSEYISENFGSSDVFLIAPDKGRVEVIKDIAGRVNVPFVSFVKRRDLQTGKIIKHEVGNEDLLVGLVDEKSIAIVFDDIISTGGTIAGIARTLREKFKFKGEIVSIFTHGLFLPGSIRKLYEGGVTRIVATDTVNNPFSVISVAPVLLDFIKITRFD